VSLWRRPASSDLVVKDQAPDQSQDQLQVAVQNVFRTCDKLLRILSTSTSATKRNPSVGISPKELGVRCKMLKFPTGIEI